MQEAPQLRRVITGHDTDGKPIIILDGFAQNHKYPDPKITSTLMWSTDKSPTDFSGSTDEGARILGTVPPENGSRFAMMSIEPGNTFHGLHKTDTVDYIIILSGTIDMFLDAERFVTLRQGEVLVQRGTDHAWVNRGSEVCRFAAILLDAHPKRADSLSGMTNAR